MSAVFKSLHDIPFKVNKDSITFFYYFRKNRYNSAGRPNYSLAYRRYTAKIQKAPALPVSLTWPMKDYLIFRSNILEL